MFSDIEHILNTYFLFYKNRYIRLTFISYETVKYVVRLGHLYSGRHYQFLDYAGIVGITV